VFLSFLFIKIKSKPPEIKCATSGLFVLIDPDKPLFPEVIEVRFGFQKLSNLNC
jgi:hypothetical protein